eukprot:SAG11_NODE_893_length_6661_cov_7.017220_2_plen_349_part_00
MPPPPLLLRGAAAAAASAGCCCCGGGGGGLALCIPTSQRSCSPNSGDASRLCHCSYPDMLEAGVTAPQPPGALHHCSSKSDPCTLNPVEWQTHFSAWAINSAPLILGMDLRDPTALGAVWSVIANPEVLRVRRCLLSLLLPSLSFFRLSPPPVPPLWWILTLPRELCGLAAACDRRRRRTGEPGVGRRLRAARRRPNHRDNPRPELRARQSLQYQRRAGVCQDPARPSQRLGLGALGRGGAADQQPARHRQRCAEPVGCAWAGLLRESSAGLPRAQCDLAYGYACHHKHDAVGGARSPRIIAGGSHLSNRSTTEATTAITVTALAASSDPASAVGKLQVDCWRWATRG